MTQILLAATLVLLASHPTTRPTDAPVAEVPSNSVPEDVAAALRAQADAPDRARLLAMRQQLAHSYSGERLEAALDSKDDPSLRSALLALADDMAFKPTGEAPLPQGWPAFTPVLELELKSYPAYRMARTQRTDQLPDALMFWRLFGHITKNDIPMTAPVELTLADVVSQRTESMGFLYQSENVGKLGEDGSVKVIDVPAQLAISIGVRGETNARQITSASDRIEQWLAAHADEYEAAGPLRLLGYNSPSMPAEKKYYEIQRLVAKK